ncbi:Band 4.1-like protein 5 [Tupaia chinensis]|uniref:Band 4.1-like protein 5 n=1 Tax=Tupaia chinensis TaxID=246437 RepID=L8Y1P7_TUPCH|nr:Band 4.1-like protein 5 [Tupaia chinensis]
MLSFFRRTLGRRSMRKHAEKERLREAQRAATHIPAAGDAKSIITCRVSLLDGTDVSVDLPHWLDSTKSIKKQVKIGSPYCLHLRVKFYSSEPNNLREELTRYLFVLQLRQDILSGKLECPFDTAVQLAAYNLQALKDASEKLKQLETESSSLPSPRSNIDVNLNSQQSSAIANGLAGYGAPLAGKEGHGNGDGLSPISPPAPFLVDAVTR